MRFNFIFILITFSSLIMGQTDSLMYYTDSAVVIQEKAIDASKIDIKSTSSSIVEDIDNTTFATIRNGGPAVLKTILYRGFANRHFAIVWNGVNLQNPVNGTLDLNLVSNFYNDLDFIRNSSNSSYGNASSAGGLLLNQKNHHFLSARLSYQSSKNLNISLKNTIEKGIFSQTVGVDIQRNQNYYSYESLGTKLKQDYAEYNALNIHYDARLKINQHQNIKFETWIQSVNREIPPTKTIVNSFQQQEDQNNRFALIYDNQFSRKWNLRTTAVFSDEQLNYSSISVDSRANLKTYFADVGLNYNYFLKVNFSQRIDRVEANFYNSIFYRKTSSIKFHFNQALKNFNLVLESGLEVVDSEVQPINLKLGISKDINQNEKLGILFHKSYTLPTFNDLYWPQGGNPDLETENIYGSEIYYEKDFNNLELKANVYFNHINNWIQWVPNNGLSSPQNIKAINNYGIELQSNYEYQINQKHAVDLFAQYTYTRSKITAFDANSNVVGNQNIYVPKHKANFNLQLSSNRISANIASQFYGQRFTNNDNTRAVKPYFLVDLGLQYQFKETNNLKPLVFTNITNLLNEDYEHIAFYSMPLRLFEFGITINYK